METRGRMDVFFYFPSSFLLRLLDIKWDKARRSLQTVTMETERFEPNVRTTSPETPSLLKSLPWQLVTKASYHTCKGGKLSPACNRGQFVA